MSGGGRGYVLVDLPGTYSLMAHSAEGGGGQGLPLCFGGADGAVVVCDATCLERNLNLVLQTLELQPRTVVCVNLLDEAERKGVRVELEGLSRRLGVPVVGAAAGRGRAGGADGGGRGGDLRPGAAYPCSGCATRPRWSLPWPPFGPCWSPA